jgi:hypothetical protein
MPATPKPGSPVIVCLHAKWPSRMTSRLPCSTGYRRKILGFTPDCRKTRMILRLALVVSKPRGRLRRFDLACRKLPVLLSRRSKRYAFTACRRSGRRCLELHAATPHRGRTRCTPGFVQSIAYQPGVESARSLVNLTAYPGAVRAPLWSHLSDSGISYQPAAFSKISPLTEFLTADS